MDMLVEALKLTAYGMGVTFLSIGVLVGGMYLITGVFKERPQSEEESEEVQETVAPQPDESEAHNRAAAAAIAVALALDLEKGAARKNGKVWDSYVRGQRLVGASLYQMRRARQ